MRYGLGAPAAQTRNTARLQCFCVHRHRWMPQGPWRL